jgi:DNA-binding response OmpR family regulator
MQSTTILVYGSDPRLLETRAWVLSGAGFVVRTTQDMAEAEQILSTDRPGLVVLCHSLSSRKLEEILSVQQVSQHPDRVLVLTGGPGDAAPADHYESLSSFDGPRALIDKVRRMAGRPGPQTV